MNKLDYQGVISNNLNALFITSSGMNSGISLAISDRLVHIECPSSSWPNFILNRGERIEIDPLIKLAKNINTPHRMYLLIENPLDSDEMHNHLIANQFIPVSRWRNFIIPSHQKVKLNRLEIPFEFKRITRKEDLKTWVDLASDAFGTLSYQFFEDFFNLDSVTFYLGQIGSEAMATTMVFRSDNTAGIYHFFVRPAYQKQGIGRHFVTSVIQEENRNGSDWIIGQTLESSQGVADQFNPLDCGYIDIYWSPIFETG